MKQSWAQESLSIPAVIPDSQFTPLRESISNELSGKMDSIIKTNKLWHKLVKRKKMAVGIVRLSDPSHPQVAWLNPDFTMYAASLPKIAILLAAVQAFEKGTLKESPEILDELALMIRKSDNQAATRFIERIGMQNIQDLLVSAPFKFYDEKKGGGLWVGKLYAKWGKKKADPLKNLSHAANVRQVCRFYYLLALGKIINPQRSAQILNILSHPDIEHKFVKSLGTVYPHNRLFRKSGTWKQWHSDSILVWGKQKKNRYILVALVEHKTGGTILKELAGIVDTLVKQDTLK
ncbi:MAG: serine hydrolase [Fibrobacteria bacterium]|nr:serine hydrolase [Fibrobacteria bacterium]